MLKESFWGRFFIQYFFDRFMFFVLKLCVTLKTMFFIWFYILFIAFITIIKFKWILLGKKYWKLRLKLFLARFGRCARAFGWSFLAELVLLPFLLTCNVGKGLLEQLSRFSRAFRSLRSLWEHRTSIMLARILIIFAKTHLFHLLYMSKR